MEPGKTEKPRRVLIASANPLFGKGLEKIFQDRWGSGTQVVGLTSNLGDTLQAMETLQPDIVIVDYDDRSINREEFLNHFIAGDRPMQVMLVSLRGSGSAVVYDRHTLTPSEAEDWLASPKDGSPRNSVSGSSKGTGMKHFIRLTLMIIVSTVLVYLGMTTSTLLPIQASLQAQPIDELFHIHYFAIAFLFSLISMSILYSIVVFRRKPGDTEDGVYVRGNNRLEVVWTVVPILVVLVLSTFAARNLAEVVAPAQDEMVVNVTAGQWFWSYTYPETGVTSSSLYLPVNRPVLLRLTSLDVIHSFWVPEFRVKQDILPGENLVKELRITPTQIGSYTNRCAELCGGAHAYMESPVIVLSQKDFDEWMQSQVAEVMEDPVSRGKIYAQQNGCFSCHSLDGTSGVGPTYQGLYGKETNLDDGSTITVNEDYIKESITNPSVKVVNGYTGNIMPSNYGEILTDEQIADIIAYIKSVQ